MSYVITNKKKVNNDDGGDTNDAGFMTNIILHYSMFVYCKFPNKK